MDIKVFEKTLEAVKCQTGNMDNYGWFIHPIDNVMVNKCIFNGLKNRKILGFPVIVNAGVPEGTVYFLDMENLRESNG